jgi:dihydroxyacetone kinase-like predicted kinase
VTPPDKGVTRRACDGAGLIAALRAAVAHLDAHVGEVNALNVFPVPDGDTGSNMNATIRAALEEAERVADQPADRIAAAISFGSLMGARGNSGVILSQIFRGMADALGGKRRFNGLDLAHALSEGSRMAYAAVAKPVEGTILTVAREAAVAAVTAAERDDDIELVLAAAVGAAGAAVARTPSLLPILRDAGVVDAGGQGLFRVLEGALREVRGETVGEPAGTGRDERPVALPRVMMEPDTEYGYETVFLLEAVAGRELDVAAIRSELERLGESVLVAGDPRAVKVHIHNERPDAIIAFGLSWGRLSRIGVENLDEQTQDVAEARAHAAGEERLVAGGSVGGGTMIAGASRRSSTGRRAARRTRPDEIAISAAGAAGGARGDDTSGHSLGLRSVPTGGASAAPALWADVALHSLPSIVPAHRGPSAKPAERPFAEPRTGSRPSTFPAPQPLGPGPAVVAVVAGEGLARIFESLGADQVLRGGQSANPSTGELLRVARLARAREVVILPNNANVRLAAEQAAKLCRDRRIIVVPTRNAAEGLAALLRLDRRKDAAANAGPMTDAGRAVQTLQVTEAIHDARVGGRTIRQGETIVLDPDDGLVAADSDREKAILSAVRTFTPSVGLITLFCGDGAELAEAEAVAQRIGETMDSVEVEVHNGGQPYYRYLISAD